MQTGEQTTHTADLLDAVEVQHILQVDRSTVYRMAEDGRLPAVRVGRLWRFPAARIYELAGRGSTPLDTRTTELIANLAAQLLGVMVVVTDMDGHPITEIANPCRWMQEHSGDPDVVDECISEWRALAADPDIAPRFTTGRFGFDCTHAFVRSGRELVAMVLAGGIGDSHEGFHHLDPTARERVLTQLPRVAAALAHTAPTAAGARHEEK